MRLLKLGILSLIFEHMNETLCTQIFIHKVCLNIDNVSNFSLTFVPSFLSFFVHIPCSEGGSYGSLCFVSFPVVVGILEDSSILC